MDCELVSTGAELLTGRSVNTHAQRLGRALEPRGFRLVRDTTVRDDRPSIAEAVRGALGRVAVVFVSGGLGPTCDDVTREALADVFGRAMVTDPATLDSLRARYTRLDAPLTESRARQARVLEGAAVLANPAGAAPGQRIEEGGRVLFVLPGPPREFEAILAAHVMPWLCANRPQVTPAPGHLFLICGLGESDIIDLLAKAGFDPGPLEVAYCAAPGNVEVRLTGRPGEERLLEEAVGRVRGLLGIHAFAEAREDLAAVVGRLLQRNNATLATAESCTGGLLGQRITAVAGSSAYYLGGIVAYADAVKAEMLGVPPETLARDGAVSEAVARALAEGVRARLRASFGVGVTGIAGPGGGTPAKPVGTVWWAVADGVGTVARNRVFGGDRDLVRQWSAQFALDLLRRRLLGAAG